MNRIAISCHGPHTETDRTERAPSSHLFEVVRRMLKHNAAGRVLVIVGFVRRTHAREPAKLGKFFKQAGALSDILGKTLTNGWELGLTNEIYVDHKGICHEGPGVPPDTQMDIFDNADITKVGHAIAIQKLVQIALKSTEPNK